MRCLQNTDALLWWLEGDNRLSATSRSLVNDESTVVFVSAVSAWEIATKVRIGKLAGAVEVAERFTEIIAHQHFEELSISVLKKNHSEAKEIWLVYFKKSTGKPSIDYRDPVHHRGPDRCQAKSCQYRSLNRNLTECAALSLHVVVLYCSYKC